MMNIITANRVAHYAIQINEGKPITSDDFNLIKKRINEVQKGYVLIRSGNNKYLRNKEKPEYHETISLLDRLGLEYTVEPVLP